MEKWPYSSCILYFFKFKYDTVISFLKYWVLTRCEVKMKMIQPIDSELRIQPGVTSTISAHNLLLINFPSLHFSKFASIKIWILFLVLKFDPDTLPRTVYIYIFSFILKIFIHLHLKMFEALGLTFGVCIFISYVII